MLYNNQITVVYPRRPFYIVYQRRPERESKTDMRSKSHKKRKNARKKHRRLSTLSLLVIVLALAVVAGGAVVFATGGDVSGLLPDFHVKEKNVSPLTGQVYEKELPARPLIVSIDNVGDAVPQSNLSKADLVYEFPVEGLQTRLQAVFYGEFPEFFGPIRSTRPYFVDLTREYKGIFLAHGWSPDAKKYLMSDVVPYINAMNTDCNFYRVSDKTAPHNSYIKWSEVKSKIDREGWWSKKQDIRSFKFLSGSAKNEGDAATFVDVKYTSSKCEFKYSEKTGKYTRTIDNGQKYVDKETGKSIEVSNILIQHVKSKVLDEKGRLRIDMCAGGKAVLITGGVAVKGTWSRDDLDSRTIFKDENGEEFKLTPGHTWVEVTDQNCTLTYK